MTRREFMRYAGLLGLSVAAASQMVGFVWPRKVFAATPQRGGILKISSRVHRFAHPARWAWTAPSNQIRQVAEYLTWTDGEILVIPISLKPGREGMPMATWALTSEKESGLTMEIRSHQTTCSLHSISG